MWQSIISERLHAVSVYPMNVMSFDCVFTVAHECSHICLHGDDNPDKFKSHNPLTIPMEFGWTRYVESAYQFT